MGARAHAGRLPADRRRQRLDRRVGASWRATLGATVVARAAARLRRRLLRRPDGRDRATSSASWTATRRWTRASCPLVAGPAARRGRPRPRRPPRRARRAGRCTRALANRDLARRLGLRDLGPMRAARREALLGARHRGPALRLAAGDGRPRAARAGWRIGEVDVAYLPRAGRSKVTGTVRGTAARGPRHAGGAGAMSTRDRHREGARRPGARKTRLTPPCTPARGRRARRGRAGGHARRGRRLRRDPPRPRARRRAGRLAAGGLRGHPPARRRPRRAAGRRLRRHRRARVPRRHGHAAAHAGAARRRRSRTPCSLGLAADGGWWGIGLPGPGRPRLRRRPDERAPTPARGSSPGCARSATRPPSSPVLRDVDTIADARAVAARGARTRASPTVALDGAA